MQIELNHLHQQCRRGQTERRPWDVPLHYPLRCVGLGERCRVDDRVELTNIAYARSSGRNGVILTSLGAVARVGSDGKLTGRHCRELPPATGSDGQA